MYDYFHTTGRDPIISPYGGPDGISIQVSPGVSGIFASSSVTTGIGFSKYGEVAVFAGADGGGGVAGAGLSLPFSISFHHRKPTAESFSITEALGGVSSTTGVQGGPIGLSYSTSMRYDNGVLKNDPNGSTSTTIGYNVVPGIGANQSVGKSTAITIFNGWDPNRKK